MPKAAFKFLRLIGAVVLAVFCAGLFVLLFGAFLPVWAMILIHGMQAVQDAPSHGGIILLGTIPFAAVVALCGLFPLAGFFYEEFSK